MATIFQKSIGEISLTVTTYLALQGCAPMFWGPLSDRYGRRPIFLSCLSVLVGACIGLALCPTNVFWLLFLLRCMQADGCASTVALSAGVIGDIVTPEERDGFYGIGNIGPMIAPAMAPAIGGVLFYPETARNIAGNGSPSVSLVYRAFIPIIGRGRLGTAPSLPKAMRIPYTNPFTIFLCPDEIYDLSEAEIGSWYIPVVSGITVSSVITGKIQDWDYRRVKARTPPGTLLPKELARLCFTPIYVCGFVAAICSWGFRLEYKAPKVVLGVVSFFSGYGMISVLSSTFTLMIDIMHTRSSAATACCYVSTALDLG
ncbi:multidrug transporter [Ceratocystis pirilliformis]|uniref:Multidrug transporter n=1 Tax=Ceratocystis pirilliformis TaxID=259994 RepID=A0ABR3Z6P1_9PEZI